MEPTACNSERLTLHYITIAFNVAFIVICVGIVASFIKNYVLAKSTDNSITKPSTIILLIESIFCLDTIITLIFYSVDTAVICEYGTPTAFL